MIVCWQCQTELQRGAILCNECNQVVVRRDLIADRSEILDAIGAVMAFGAKKKGDWTWLEKPKSPGHHVRHAILHLDFLDEKDHESGLLNIDHAIARLVMARRLLRG